MNVLRVAASKGDHLRLLYRVGGVKSLWHEVVNALHIRSDPFFEFEIECPQIIQI